MNRFVKSTNLTWANVLVVVFVVVATEAGTEREKKKKKKHFCCLRNILYKYETTKPCYIRCNGTSSGNVLRWCSCRKKIARNNRLLSTFRASSSLHRNISTFLKRNCYLDKRRAFAEFNVVPVNFFLIVQSSNRLLATKLFDGRNLIGSSWKLQR